jgi:ATP/maltotriose-dependent transcriptional regulator MalT
LRQVIVQSSDPAHQRGLHRRRVIERPRLLALLDESTARVRTLVAPAGYGKTTLAEQWIARDGYRAAWFTARPSSTDVAALALGVAHATTELVPGSDDRLREHLRLARAPSERAEIFAEILAEELAGWPSDGWLVLDDYQEIAVSPDAERFVAALVEASPVQLLIASRQRPAWATARRILYGEVLELNQTELAMDGHEAAEVLVDRSTPSASGLVALANGWPAVIALASVSRAEVESHEEVPESLYRFFAEEVFGAFSEEVQSGLSTLAAAPVLERELVVELLGADHAEALCDAALRVGILVERGSRLDLHPLARSFLEERHGRKGFELYPDVVPTCVEHYRDHGDFDAAFEVIARNGRADLLEPLALAALDELLETARLSTIETWCDLARSAGLDAPVFALARAEVALRTGRSAEVATFAEAAAGNGSDLAARALSVAGLNAHLVSQEEEGLSFFRRAEAVAQTAAIRRNALWGQAMCLIELDHPDAAPTLERLAGGAVASDPREAVRAAGHRLFYGIKSGRVDLSEADAAARLLPVVDDAIVETGFLSCYGYALALAARYEDARRVARNLLELAHRYRLDFAELYGHIGAAQSAAGLRNWSESERHLETASAAAHAKGDGHAMQASFTLRVRTLAQRGRFEQALALEQPDLTFAIPQARAEVVGAVALVLTCVGKVDEAGAALDEVRGISRGTECLCIISAVDALAGLKRHERDATDRVLELESVAFETNAVDILVTAYRSTPELLAVLLRATSDRERLQRLIRRARDEDLAGAVGHPLPSPDDDPRARLSRREREVFELLRQGLTNLQIAETLVISESTVKVHVHHIYDKLGVRSRTALAVQAMLERSEHD